MRIHNSACRLATPLMLAALLAVSGTSRANVETWVEAELEDCTSGTPRKLYPLGTINTPDGGHLDPDTTRGTGEDSDGDEIFGSISVAETNTNAGGIVYIPIQGVHRDTAAVDIQDSKTIHGFSAKDVILSGDCVSEAAAAFDITLSTGSDTVLIENITIQGYATAFDLNSTSAGTVILRNVVIKECTTAVDVNTMSGGTLILDNVTIEGSTTAIDLTGTTGGLLMVRDSTLDDNTTGIADDGGSLEVRVSNTKIRGGARGIDSVLTLTVVDSEISDHSVYGIVSEHATLWRISGSVVSHCTNEGIAVQGGGTGTQVVEVTNSRIFDNGDSGIAVDGSAVTFDLHDSVVSGNGDDGVHLQGHADSTYSVTGTALTGNTDRGLLVQNTMTCTSDLTDTFSGVVMESHINNNGGDGIEIGGTASCNPPTTYPGQVECGILANTISANGAYGIDRAGLASAFHCGVGGNIISYNVSGNANGTSACTGTSTSTNQSN